MIFKDFQTRYTSNNNCLGFWQKNKIFISCDAFQGYHPNCYYWFISCDEYCETIQLLTYQQLEKKLKADQIL